MLLWKYEQRAVGGLVGEGAGEWVFENPRSSAPWLGSCLCSRTVQSPMFKSRTLSHEERAQPNLVYICYTGRSRGMFSKDFLPKWFTWKHFSISKCQFQGFILKLCMLLYCNVIRNSHIFSCSKFTVILRGRYAYFHIQIFLKKILILLTYYFRCRN